MQIHTDKTRKSTIQAVAHHFPKKHKDSSSLLSDHRPETIAQRQLAEIANNSPQAQKTTQLQSVIEKSREKQLPIQKKENHTGLPDHLKTNMENLSGYSLDDVNVHYNSAKPAQLSAHAYAQGSDIHIAPGQEKHLPHEAWHIVQQKQGRVKPTLQMKSGVQINDDKGLEKEADDMGSQASRFSPTPQRRGIHTRQEVQLKGKGSGNRHVQQLHPIQFTLIDRLKSGFDKTSIAAGLTVGAAIAFFGPLGLGLASAGIAGAAVSGIVSYARGSDTAGTDTTTTTHTPKKKAQTEQPKKQAASSQAPRKSVKKESNPVVDKEAERNEQEARARSVITRKEKFDTNSELLLTDLKEVHHELLDLQPLLGDIPTATSAQLDAWVKGPDKKRFRTAIVRNQRAIRTFDDFSDMVKRALEVPPLKILSKDDFSRKEILDEWKIQLNTMISLVSDLEHNADETRTLLEEALAEGKEIKAAWDRPRPQENVHEDEAHGGHQAAAVTVNGWLTGRYTHGWVNIVGNSYAAITNQAATSIPGDLLLMFQDALRNGSINDKGVGESGVKWAKKELKVRRTRLESIQVAGDTRLTGDIQTITAAASGLPNDIRVLEFTHTIHAH